MDRPGGAPNAVGPRLSFYACWSLVLRGHSHRLSKKVGSQAWVRRDTIIASLMATIFHMRRRKLMALISLQRIAFAASALTAAVALGLSTLVTPAYSVPLLINGDFETTIVPDGSFMLFPPSTITGWTVVGNPGTVAIVKRNFTQFENGINFFFLLRAGSSGST
jgi:hypothetical protein